MPFSSTEEQKKQVLHHVFYEIRQLFLTTEFMESDSWDGIPSWRNDAIIESQLLHVRNLREFFAHKSRNDDNVLAAHFGFALSEVDIKQSTLARLNKDLAHLTYARIRRTAETKEWPVSIAAVPVLKQCGVFIQHICESFLSSKLQEAGEWRMLKELISIYLGKHSKGSSS